VTKYRDSLLARCLRVVSLKDRRKIVLVTILQIFINLLDLVGVAVVGVLGALTITGIRSQQPGTRVSALLSTLQLDGIQFQKQVAILGGLAMCALIIRTVLSIYFTKRTLRFLANRSALISGDLVSKLLSRPLLEIQTRSTQENLYAVTTGVSIITVGVIGSLVMSVADVSLLVIMIAALFVVDPTVSVTTTLLFGAIGFGLYRFMHVRVASIGATQMDLSIKGNDSILDALNSYRELVVSNRRGVAAQKILTQRLALANLTADLQFMPILSKYLIESTVVLAAVIISAIQFLLQDSTRAIATLAVFLAAGSRIAPAVLRLQQNSLQIRNSLAASSSTLEILEEYKNLKTLDVNDSRINQRNSDFKPSVSVRNVNFSYPGTTTEVLKNINLEVSPGDFVAITGISGSGKSTLVDLILGVMDPKSGEIKISGTSPLDAFKEWPEAVGYVPQDVYLIQGTVRDNFEIGLNKSQNQDDRYIKALVDAKMEFIFSPPNLGLDTMVGENGTKLSGGQRQRLGIARALTTSPQLLVLDEATSSLDSETESELTESIQALKGSSTIIMIAHRLSTVRQADKVVYLNEGRIQAIGTFEEVRSQVPNFDNQAKLMCL
jgi:ABC-type multidrug transport system fused ATPase/permease subunit